MTRFFSTDGVAATAAVLALASVGCGTRVAASHVHVPVAPASVSDRTADLCAGLPEVEQERPAFLRADGIEAVRPVTSERAGVKFAEPELRGADIVLRPSTTVTKFMVMRALRCHMADPVALALTEGFGDPLVVGEPAVSLEQTGDHVVVRIVAGHAGALGEEILRRAEQLQRPE